MSYNGDRMFLPGVAASVPTWFLKVYFLRFPYTFSQLQPPDFSEQDNWRKEQLRVWFDAMSSSLRALSQKDPYWKGKFTKGRQGKEKQHLSQWLNRSIRFRKAAISIKSGTRPANSSTSGEIIVCLVKSKYGLSLYVQLKIAKDSSNNKKERQMRNFSW